MNSKLNSFTISLLYYFTALLLYSYLSVAYITALMVCMRFSASSKTLD